MKKVTLILALIFLLSVPVFAQAQYNFLGIGLIGLSNTTLMQLSQNQAQFFDSAVWGINARLKLSKFFGLALDIFYVGKMYYYSVYDETTSNDYWYGPVTWDIVPHEQGVSEDSWHYYHDEFYINLDVGIYLPLYFLQLYFEFGPSFFRTQPSEKYDTDTGFATYYDSIYGSGGFTVGLNFKIGLDLFVTRGISLGMFLYFLEHTFSNFFANIQNKDYILNNGYVGLELVFWL